MPALRDMLNTSAEHIHCGAWEFRLYLHFASAPVKKAELPKVFLWQPGYLQQL